MRHPANLSIVSLQDQHILFYSSISAEVRMDKEEAHCHNHQLQDHQTDRRKEQLKEALGHLHQKSLQTRLSVYSSPNPGSILWSLQHEHPGRWHTMNRDHLSC